MLFWKRNLVSCFLHPIILSPESIDIMNEGKDQSLCLRSVVDFGNLKDLC